MRAVYHADVAHVGKRLKCSHCGFIVVIEKQQPSSPATADPDHIQTSKHSPDVPVKPKGSKPHFLWAVFFGASLLVAASMAIWSRYFTGQPGETAQRSQVESALPQRGEGHEGHSKGSKSTANNLPSSNPFGSVPVGSSPFAATQNDQPLASSPAQPPEPRPSHYRSLPSGTRITEDSGVGGHGKLSVSNRTGVDAVVRLYDRYTLETVRWFFVKANASYAVKSIPQGDYVLAYTAGLDWVDSEDAFRWSPSYHEFEKPVSYSEQTDTTGTRYDEISVTLHPVIGGNVRTKSISRSDFLRGHRHVSF